MLSQLDKNSVKSFLTLCQKEIPKGNCYLVPRTLKVNGHLMTTKQALLDLGILDVKLVWKYILELKVEDCVKVDFDYDTRRDTNSEVYVFKKVINGKLTYIKLTLRPNGIICLSFHHTS